MSNEVEYIHKIAPYLERFRETNDGKFNFSCPLCGDGDSGYKSRAWFIERDTYLFNCFNCSAQMPFGAFLKIKFPEIYKEYLFDKLKRSGRGKRELVFKEKKSIDTTTHKIVKSLLKPYTENLDAVEYLKSRKIPDNAYKDIFIIQNFRDLTYIDKYKKSAFEEEPRIILPIYNKDGLINGIISRAISPKSKKRYINLKFYDDYSIFGLYNGKGEYKINLNKTITICEGAFDSMFIPNGVAVNTSDLLLFRKALPENLSKRLKVVYVPDNDKRNIEITNVYKKIIEANQKIVIFPSYIKEKDINDIILNNDIDIVELIQENTFQGIQATIKFNQWKKV